MFVKGKPKTGGRQKGVLNKKSRTLLEICESKGFSPFEAMLELAIDGDKDMLKEVSQYLYPKRKAIEHSVDPALAEAADRLEQMNREEKIALLKEELKKLEGT